MPEFSKREIHLAMVSIVATSPRPEPEALYIAAEDVLRELVRKWAIENGVLRVLVDPPEAAA